MSEIKLIIRNKVDLHARPAVLFVQAAQGLDEFSMGAAAIPLAKELIRPSPAQTPRSSTE